MWTSGDRWNFSDDGLDEKEGICRAFVFTMSFILVAMIRRTNSIAVSHYEFTMTHI